MFAFLCYSYVICYGFVDNLIMLAFFHLITMIDSTMYEYCCLAILYFSAFVTVRVTLIIKKYFCDFVIHCFCLLVWFLWNFLITFFPMLSSSLSCVHQTMNMINVYLVTIIPYHISILSCVPNRPLLFSGFNFTYSHEIWFIKFDANCILIYSNFFSP
jgi:hypothetical protein